MEPRRCRRGNTERGYERLVESAASMERRRCRRGNFTWKRDEFARYLASMEPRRCRRGNGKHEAVKEEPKQLQWSHGVAAVEIEAWHAGLAGVISASMEPRRCRRG